MTSCNTAVIRSSSVAKDGSSMTRKDVAGYNAPPLCLCLSKKKGGATCAFAAELDRGFEGGVWDGNSALFRALRICPLTILHDFDHVLKNRIALCALNFYFLLWIKLSELTDEFVSERWGHHLNVGKIQHQIIGGIFFAINGLFTRKTASRPDDRLFKMVPNFLSSSSRVIPLFIVYHDIQDNYLLPFASTALFHCHCLDHFYDKPKECEQRAYRRELQQYNDCRNRGAIRGFQKS